MSLSLKKSLGLLMVLRETGGLHARPGHGAVGRREERGAASASTEVSRGRAGRHGRLGKAS